MNGLLKKHEVLNITKLFYEKKAKAFSWNKKQTTKITGRLATGVLCFSMAL